MVHIGNKGRTLVIPFERSVTSSESDTVFQTLVVNFECLLERSRHECLWVSFPLITYDKAYPKHLDGNIYAPVGLAAISFWPRARCAAGKVQRRLYSYALAQHDLCLPRRHIEGAFNLPAKRTLQGRTKTTIQMSIQETSFRA